MYMFGSDQSEEITSIICIGCTVPNVFYLNCVRCSVIRVSNISFAEYV